MFIAFISLLLLLFLTVFSLYFWWQKDDVDEKKDVLHADADVLASIIQRYSAMPSSILVRSRFSELRYKRGAAMALRQLLAGMDTKFPELIGIMEGKFMQIDFRVSRVLRYAERFYGEEDKSQLFDSQERKYQTLTENIRHLTVENRIEPFLRGFLALNEFLNIYLRQLDCLLEEQKKSVHCLGT